MFLKVLWQSQTKFLKAIMFVGDMAGTIYSIVNSLLKGLLHLSYKRMLYRYGDQRMSWIWKQI